MVSFAVVFFFAATGITLNHAEWFSRQVQTIHYRGIVPASLLHESSDPHPDKLAPDKLGIVELLRNRHKIHGSVSDFRVEDSQISISFKGPGYAADAFIDATNGSYDLAETRSGFVAILNDLHKGSRHRQRVVDCDRCLRSFARSRLPDRSYPDLVCLQASHVGTHSRRRFRSSLLAGLSSLCPLTTHKGNYPERLRGEGL
jgi:hypothetical protein